MLNFKINERSYFSHMHVCRPVHSIHLKLNFKENEFIIIIRLIWWWTCMFLPMEYILGCLDFNTIWFPFSTIGDNQPKIIKELHFLETILVKSVLNCELRIETRDTTLRVFHHNVHAFQRNCLVCYGICCFSSPIFLIWMRSGCVCREV